MDSVITALNEGCFCVSLDQQALREAMESTLGEPGLMALLEERCPHAFSSSPVFMTADSTRQVAALVRAVEEVVAMPAFRARVLADAAPIARHDPGGARGVFFGYDFHVHKDGIALIEINTNAGGAMLNLALARAQKACCASVDTWLPSLNVENMERDLVAMFAAEWQLSGREGPLRTVAIVDTDPASQYLYPEFLLFEQLFRRHGIEAIIADPSALVFRDGALWHGDTAIDLVYNRLTDFMLEAPGSGALRAAYLAHAVVLTPHPQAHALYADKRNLSILGDQAQLEALGVDALTRAVLLAAIPTTEIVDPAHAERLWAERRKLFFKPAAGYGSKAAYRGEKITKRVWEEILAGQYVAQAFVAPSERAAEGERFKFDVRAYAYDGRVQLLAARLYQGQTTNFRTPGGGFSPVYPIEDGMAAPACQASCVADEVCTDTAP
jgi:hypothetical protein